MERCWSGNLLRTSRDDAFSYKGTQGGNGWLLPVEGEPMYLLIHEGSQSEGKADLLTLAEGKDGEGISDSTKLLPELASSGLRHHVIHFLLFIKPYESESC